MLFHKYTKPFCLADLGQTGEAKETFHTRKATYEGAWESTPLTGTCHTRADAPQRR